VSRQPSRLATPAAKRLSLADVSSKGSGLPNRYILHGVEKIGKTSFAAYAPSPIFIETRGENGLETLIDAGRLPEIPHFPEVQTWSELLSCLDTLTKDEHKYRTVVIDTINGAERLCHEEVCRRDFNNDWGEHGFTSYQKGYDVSLADWRQMLSMLDTLRETRKMSILCLCHTRVKTFRNPEGADYDRWSPDMNDKTWGLTHKWADAVVFVNFETFVDQKDPKRKGKASDNQQRIMFTERHAAYDAGNRFGLPTEILLGNNGQEAWNAFRNALTEARKTTQPAPAGEKASV